MSAGRTVLITGASRGIGRATALWLAARGFRVAASMRSPKDHVSLGEHPNIELFALDVQRSDQVATAVAQVVGRFGRIDALVNNAGYGASGPIEALADESMRRIFDVNVFGALRVTRAVLPHMRRARAGVIVNVSSVGARCAFPLGTLYHGTKWALEGMSEALAYELSAVGVRIKTVEPGITATDFASASFELFGDADDDAYGALVQGATHLLAKSRGAGTSAEDVARVVEAAIEDRTDRLRFVAGADAEALLARRRELPEEDFLRELRARFSAAP